ncbi:MAG: DNA-binding protein WhiA [Lachnospiraceae bacterium]|nr:DNA-binding protein WhiA [Lachnospiraceae bacterium]
MSFSSQVKEELEKHISSGRHCQIAEMAAILHFSGKLVRSPKGELFLQILTENVSVARKCFTILDKSFNIETSSLEQECFENRKNAVYTITLKKEQDILSLFQGIKLIDSRGVLHELKDRVNPLILKQSCCQRAFLRGAFLTIGSMSDPEKSYHLELVCPNQNQARQLQELIRGFELDAKIVIRKKYFVVYLKEGSNIVDFLNICEAHVSLMNLENTRILKEMRNSVNRRVNCETANIAKTVNAATKQLEDILYIKEFVGLSRLPLNLKQMAEVRLEYPEATLKELGQYLEPPVGKSGVNHRLRKLSEIADFHRGHGKG